MEIFFNYFPRIKGQRRKGNLLEIELFEEDRSPFDCRPTGCPRTGLCILETPNFVESDFDSVGDMERVVTLNVRKHFER